MLKKLSIFLNSHIENVNESGDVVLIDNIAFACYNINDKNKGRCVPCTRNS